MHETHLVKQIYNADHIVKINEELIELTTEGSITTLTRYFVIQERARMSLKDLILDVWKDSFKSEQLKEKYYKDKVCLYIK